MLEEVSRSGEFDSRGEFTLAPHLAARKLAEFQLAEPSLWILKVVQSAVAGGSQSLTVRQERQRTRFLLKEPRSDFSLSKLRDSLGMADPPEEAYLEHLVVALRTVGMAESRPWTISAGGELLSWDGEKFDYESREMSAPDVHLEVGFRPDQTRGRLSNLFGSVGVARDEYLQLVRRAHVCPIPITFDGRRLDHGKRSRQLPRGSEISHLCFGFTAPTVESEEDVFSLPGGFQRESWRPTDRLMDGRVFFVDGDPDQKRATAFLELCYLFEIDDAFTIGRKFQWRTIKAPSYCHWVHHGVVAHQTRLAIEGTAIVVDLYLPAEGLSTDISGLSLRESAENRNLMVRRRARGLAKVARSAIATKKALAQRWVQPFDSHLGYFGTMTLPFVPAAVLATPFFLLMMTTAIVPIMVTSAADKKKIVRDILSNLDRLAINARDVKWD